MSTVPRDYNELEHMPLEKWDQVLGELKAENKGVGDTLAAWMENHKGHQDAGIRWWVPDGTLSWHAHGRCNQCRVDSGMHHVGNDDPEHVDPSLLRFLKGRR